MENKVISFTPHESDKIAAHRKEDRLHREYALIDLETGESRVILRIYWPATVAYACVWTFGTGFYARGAGRAGGGGYCKASAAASDSLRDAGFKLEHPIDGRGLESIRGALEAIGRHMGLARFMVHVAHG